MKRLITSSILTILLMLLTTACVGTKNMEVTYNIRPSTSLKNLTVYLLVNDVRPSKELVGSNARSKDLFKELYGGRFDLKVNMPSGSTVTMTNLTAKEAVYEAANWKLQSLGASATNQRSQAHITMELDIQQLDVDLENSDLVARVTLASKIYRDSNMVNTSNAGATSNRIKLIGSAGGATVFSDALSQAMNELDFGAINKY